MTDNSSVETESADISDIVEDAMSWYTVLLKSISCLMGRGGQSISKRKSVNKQTNENQVSPQFHTYFVSQPSPTEANPHSSSISQNIPVISLPPADYKLLLLTTGLDEAQRQIGDPGLLRNLGKVEDTRQFVNPRAMENLEQVGNLEQIRKPEQIEDPRKQVQFLQPGPLASLSYPMLHCSVLNPTPNPEVMTEDNLHYQFYPVSSGFVQFKVRASNDAHIALTMGLQETDPKIEVFIGGWGNTKSSISREKITSSIPLSRSIEVETPKILNGYKFRGFWVRWDCGIISAGYENKSIPFISWADPEPFPISYVGVRTSWGATGTWKIEEGAEFITTPYQGYVYKPCTARSLEFEYRGMQNCFVCLTAARAEVEPICEIILRSSENTPSEIRYNKQKTSKVTAFTPRILDPKEFKKFLVEWRCGKVQVRVSDAVILEWTDPAPFPITHFGLRTGSGDWRIKHFPTHWHTLR